MNNSFHGRGVKPLHLGRLFVLALLPLAAACDTEELLNLTDPDVVFPSALTDSSSLPAFRAAAIGDLIQSYSGGGGDGDNLINYSGMLSDELVNSETFPTRIQIDIRKIDELNSNVQGVTRQLYRARTLAENAVIGYHEFSPNNIGLAESFNLAAATYIFFGENYCSGVPFSAVNADGTFTFGGQETTTQIYQRAVDAADSALAVAGRAVASTAAKTQQQSFARVLKGRALLNLNQPAAAAAAVAPVLTSFAYLVFHSENTARENNQVYVSINLNNRYSVTNKEGINGLPYRDNFTAGDWRTPWVRRTGTGLGFDAVTPQYYQLKYITRSDTVPLANGVEARLIEAEAALRAGNSAGAFVILNALRTTPPPGTTLSLTSAALTPLVPDASAAGQVNQLFAERAYWMWLTAHRLGDMRRLVRQYGRTQASVFPTGAYHKAVQGGQYGTDVNLPLSVDERNNPELNGIPADQSLCLDRNA
jgi:starch-binding outer membrane protein, SusD/RagB family